MTMNDVFIWTEFTDHRALTKKERSGTWGEFIDRLTTAGTFPDKGSCPWLKLAKFGDKRSAQRSLRHDANMLATFGIEGDYDGRLIAMEDAIKKLEKHGVRAVTYPTPSSTVQAPRWRVLCPLAQQHTPGDHAGLVARLNGSLGGILAPESFTLSQGYFFGDIGTNDYRVRVTFDDPNAGSCIDTLPDLDRIAIKKGQKPKADSTSCATAGATHADDDDDIAPMPTDPAIMADLRSALTALRADDRGMWVDVGHALKTLGDQGRSLWLEWSQTSAKYEPEDAACKWGSFTPLHTGYQAVFAKAQAAGWVNPMSRDRRNETKVEFSALLDSTIDADTGEIVQPKVPTEPAGFAFVSVRDLLVPKPVTYLIDQTMETDCLALLFAPMSAGKSFLAISWACSVATGTPWLDREAKQGAVFYLAGEGHAGLSRRLAAWELQSGNELASAPLFVSKVPAQLMDMKSAVDVVKSIERLAAVHGRPALIVVDTFARNMGPGDENSNADISVFVNHIDHMRAHLGCVVLLVHHTGHMEGERARGGSSLPAAMDAIYRIDNKASGLSLIHVKAKEDELSSPLALSIEQVELPGWLDAKGRVMNSAVMVAGVAVSMGQYDKPLTQTQQDVMNAFFTAAREYGVLDADGEFAGLHVEHWRTEVYKNSTADNTAAKKTSFHRARKDLAKLGQITVSDDLYQLSGLRSFMQTGFADELREKQARVGVKDA
jgi:hypothetical protein